MSKAEPISCSALDDPASLPGPSAYNVVPKWAVERDDVFPIEIERVFEGPMWHLRARISACWPATRARAPVTS